MRYTDANSRLAIGATAAILVVAACSSTALEQPGGIRRGPIGRPIGRRTLVRGLRRAVRRRRRPERPAGQDQGGRRHPGRHRPGLPAAVGAQEGRHVRGLRHRYGQRDRQATRRQGQVRDARLLGRRGRQVGRPVRYQRRVGDDHQEAAGQPRLHRPVLLHAGPDGATTASGITTLEGLAGKTVCVGDGDHLLPVDQRQLSSAMARRWRRSLPGMKATTLKTDQDCALSAKSGRHDFEGWLSSSTTVAAGHRGRQHRSSQRRRPGLLRAARGGHRQVRAAHAELQAALDQIVKDMHADGTLTAFSKKWFEGQDLTAKE